MKNLMSGFHLHKSKIAFITVAIFSIFIFSILVFSVFLPETFSQPKFFRKALFQVHNLIFLTRDHGLTCSELPTINQVQTTLNTQQNKVNELLNLSSLKGIKPENLISVYNGENYRTEKCPEKADLLFIVQTRDERKEIEQKIGKDFFGIPYRIINV